MKKVVFLFLVMTSVAHATEGAAAAVAAKVETNKARTMAAFIVGSAIAVALEKIPADYMSTAVTKGAQLSVALLSMGITFQKPEMRDAGIRTPFLLLAAQAAEVPEVREIAHSLPYGIGDALKATGEKATTALLSIVTYKYALDPVLGWFLYQTKPGKFMMGMK
ncbi:MAG: hypothetical protein WCK49_03450 [Myxococcaceae bacterium]